MLIIRIVTAGAMLVAMAGAAAAQTDDGATPGKPILLLQVSQPAKAKPNAHTKFVRKHKAKTARKFASRKTHFAARKDDPPPADTTALAPAAAASIAPAAAADVTAASVWPADTATSPAAVAVPAPPDAPPAPPQSPPSATAGGGETAQVPSLDQVNAADLATGAPRDSAPALAPVDQAGGQQDTVPAVALAQQAGGKSRDAWYEGLLATLGGALAAASVAWFLIGFAPPRRDDRDRILIYETERMTR